jgi:uncharacterized protein YjbI with pentapeptide repeats
MRARFRSWWQKTSKTLDAVVILMLVVLLALTLVSILGYTYNWNWAGLHGKTFWDWLQLLIIPAVLAVGGYLFNYTTSRNERKATQLRDQTERDIALDNQHEQALQAYIDNMSELLLEKQLRESGQDDEVRKIARVRTLTVLPRLDEWRKLSVLQFLHESDLIDKDKSIIDLFGADLREARLKEANLGRAMLAGADLRGANLIYADLSDADLSKADLVEAYLIGANLTRANLNESNLGRADLSEANLSGAKVTAEQLDRAKSLKGATMPDGTVHP